MNQRGGPRRVWVVLTAGLLIGVGAWQGIAQSAKRATSEEEELYKELELFEHALSIVRADYVEPPESKKLIYGAVRVQRDVQSRIVTLR